MNLYDLHVKPTSLSLYKEAQEAVPALIWEKYKNKPAELEKREAVIAMNPWYSYLYVMNVLRGPFPAGEAAIATSAKFSYMYALGVLRGPFPAGEAAIAKDALRSFFYSKCILKGRFPAGEAAIFKDPEYKNKYEDFLASLKK